MGWFSPGSFINLPSFQRMGGQRAMLRHQPPPTGETAQATFSHLASRCQPPMSAASPAGYDAQGRVVLGKGHSVNSALWWPPCRCSLRPHSALPQDTLAAPLRGHLPPLGPR